MASPEISRVVTPRNAAWAAIALAGVLIAIGVSIVHRDAVRGEEENAVLAAQLGLSEYVVSNGEEIDVQSYLIPGKTTVFDFYSRFCPPCMALKPLVERLPDVKKDVVLVEVDINRRGVVGIDWNSPVARQYHLNAIPHLAVYGPDGALIAEDTASAAPARELVMGWLAR